MTKRINIKHIFIQIFFQAIAAAAWAFGIYSLMERGFDSGQAGLCMALQSIFSFFLQPTVSNYIDNSKKLTVFEVTAIMLGINIVLFVANCLIRNAGLMLAFIFTLTFGIYSASEPLINSISNKFSTAGINIEFSKARAAGSMSYGVMCVVFGQLTTIYDYSVVLYGGLIFMIALLISILLIRKDYYQVPYADNKEKEEAIGYLEFIRNNKTYVILCLFACGLFFGYTCVDNFMLLIVEKVGGNSGDMGSNLGFKAAVEALAIFLYAAIRKKISLKTVLRICAISYVLKAGITCISQNVFMLYVSQLFQATSFAFFLPGMVEYVDAYMNKKEAVRGQSAITMALILGTTLSSLFGGYIANIYGTSTMEMVALIVTILASIGYYVTVNKMFENE